MPPILSNQVLDRIQYVSLADYMRQVEQYDDFQDKLAFTTRYLLSHGMQEGRDHPFEEVVHAAKMKIADASAKLRRDRILVPADAVNPEVDAREDADNRLFLADPTIYLRREAHRLLDQAGPGPFTAEQEARLLNYQVVWAELTGDLEGRMSAKISRYDFGHRWNDIDLRLEGKFGGKRAFEKAYDATKPGVLSRMFDTSSKAYHNLDEVYQAFSNRDHVLYGDMNALDKAAIEYLQHCFPRWDPKQGGISSGAINRLSGTKKARALFSLNILKSTAEQRKMESCYEGILNSNREALAQAEGGIAEEGNVFVSQQENDELQRDIQQQIAREEAPEVDQEQAERDYHANFEPIEEEDPLPEP